MAHRDLSRVLVWWLWFHSPSFDDIHDRPLTVLRSFSIPVPCTVQLFFRIFCRLWLAGVPFVTLFPVLIVDFLPCASLSSSADPIFFVQC
jgi:hypothetical protein